jgi:hypothetical protein
MLGTDSSNTEGWTAFTESMKATVTRYLLAIKGDVEEFTLCTGQIGIWSFDKEHMHVRLFATKCSATVD